MWRDCRFNFGTDWDFVNQNRNSATAQNIDYLTAWIISPDYSAHVKNGVLWAVANNKTMVLYSYVIAKSSGLGDADMGGQLNIKGAGHLQRNINAIANIYGSIANGIANDYGITKPIIFLMEPDYYQYFSGSQDVKLTYAQSNAYMNLMITEIRKHLPNAHFGLDIAPWAIDQGQLNSYIEAFTLSNFSVLFQSGGRTEGNTERIRNENMATWREVVNIANKPIMADCGYGVGGICNGLIASWNSEANLRARVADGVVAITQKFPDGDWGNIVSNLKNSLANDVTRCVFGGG